MVEKKIHCPKCGKIVNQVYNGLCNVCYTQTADLFDLDKKEIKICSTCNNLFEGSKVIKNKSYQESFNQIIKQRINPNKKLKKFNAVVDSDYLNNKVILSNINIKALSDAGIEINDDYSFEIKIREITCEQCSKKNTEYFEAILQIRNKNDNIIKEVLSELDLILEDEKKRSVFATKLLELKNGVDIYITSQKHVKEIGRRLYDIFGGEIKINEQLFSRNHLTSKNLYRINLLLRIPDFKKHSVIKIDEKLIFVTSIKGNFILGKDVLTNKSIKTKYDLNDIEIIQDKPIETIIVKEKPHYEILNPITFQNQIVMNPEVIEIEQNKEIQRNNNRDSVIDKNSKSDKDSVIDKNSKSDKNNKKMRIDQKINIVLYNDSVWVI
jgi:nonsense-mediated mRNA decay protein 3